MPKPRWHKQGTYLQAGVVSVKTQHPQCTAAPAPPILVAAPHSSLCFTAGECLFVNNLCFFWVERAGKGRAPFSGMAVLLGAGMPHIVSSNEVAPSSRHLGKTWREKQGARGGRRRRVMAGVGGDNCRNGALSSCFPFLLFSAEGVYRDWSCEQVCLSYARACSRAFSHVHTHKVSQIMLTLTLRYHLFPLICVSFG